LKNFSDIWWGQHFRTNTYGRTNGWKRLALSNGPKVWYLYPPPHTSWRKKQSAFLKYDVEF